MKSSKSDINLLKTFIESNTQTKPINIKSPRNGIYTRYEYNLSKSDIDINYSIYVDNPLNSSSPDNLKIGRAHV